MRGAVIILVPIILTAFSFVTSSHAQPRACDLKLRIFAYEPTDKSKVRLKNVTVRLRGKGIDRTVNAGVEPDEATFAGLEERTYELEFSKLGYKARRKNIDLDCRLVRPDAVWDHTYLWRTAKGGSVDGDLVSEPRGESRPSSDGGDVDSPKEAKAGSDGLFGAVRLQVLIDEDGNVISASLLSGDRKLAAKAGWYALTAKFAPTILSGEAVRVSGSLTYRFVP